MLRSGPALPARRDVEALLLPELLDALEDLQLVAHGHSQLLQVLVVHLQDRLQVLYPVVYEEVLVLGDELWAAAAVEEHVDLGMHRRRLLVLLLQRLHQVRCSSVFLLLCWLLLQGVRQVGRWLNCVLCAH